MKVLRAFLVLASMILALQVQSATISGIVLDDNGDPLVGANVYWEGTTDGMATDVDGKFTIQTNAESKRLITSYTGYRNDTTAVKGKSNITIVLVDDLVLDQVTISARKMAVLRSRTSAFDTETLSGEELCKAACCNLSESFETSASVDVAYSDAATGAKQIRLLGLSGTYVQLLNENTPGVRGLGQNFGLEYIPGPWMYSIQVSKGTSSVINGYEAISGQINVELQKPQLTDPLSINAMFNSELHQEVNMTGGWKMRNNKNISTGVLAHIQSGSYEMDHNNDGFMDMPKTNQLNLINRWNFKHGDYTAQVFVRGIYDHRMGGQMRSRRMENDKNNVPDYAIDLTTNRIEGFMKNGFLINEDQGMSIGIITAASYHDQRNDYGIYRSWNADQTNAYFNAIFQTNLGEGRVAEEDDHENKLSVGVSVNYDRYDERAEDDHQSLQLRRRSDEITPGVFVEYTYMFRDKVTLLLGVREDYSSVYGWFTTPRANVRLAPWKWWHIRGSVGLGYRSPNVIADNASFLVSNRWLESTSKVAYHQQKTIQNFDNAGVSNFETPQECALNTGFSTTFYIPMGSRELQLSGEYYYTKFLDGIVADWDYSAKSLLLRPIGDDVQSFGNNWQVELNMELLRGWTITTAFRYTDVKNRYEINGKVQTVDKPLTNKFKGIVTTSYQTPLKKWQFDFTAQFNGYGRMPAYFMGHGDQYYKSGDFYYHKWYPQLLGQITHYFRKCSVYVGAENMTDFRQHNPVISGNDPYNDNFDASMVWGPINGWKLYAGFRWALTED